MRDSCSKPQSLWLEELDESLEPRPALERDEKVDVAIVGAGYTGLWTAYYLSVRSPDLSVAIVESAIAGYGASGRNGGWCSPHHDGIRRWLGGSKREGAIALQHAMFDTIDEIGRVVDAEAIRCDYAKSGYLTVATSEGECKRAQLMLPELYAIGLSEADYRWLDATECNQHVNIANARGGIYSPHAAVVQPAKLARGLARAVEKRGVRIFEASPVRSIRGGEVVTNRARLYARAVLRCTEGYTARIPGLKRRLLPMHPMMIATEPLSDAQWREIGAASRVLFGDMHRIFTWAQRTADGRIAIGRGGHYFFGSAVRDEFAPSSPVFAPAQQALIEQFPFLSDVGITHRWGGPIALSRDTTPYVRFDPHSGVGSAGGYVGSGVTTSNLAGRTLAALVAGIDSELLTLPWVQHRCRAWEPEPLRWLGVKSVWHMGGAADDAERRGRSAGWRGALFESASGH